MATRQPEDVPDLVVMTRRQVEVLLGPGMQRVRRRPAEAPAPAGTLRSAPRRVLLSGWQHDRQDASNRSRLAG